MSFFTKDLICLFLILVAQCTFTRNFEPNTIFITTLFLIFIWQKLSYIKTLKNKLNQEREIFIKTLNHDLKVAALAQLRALEYLIKNNQKDFEIINEIKKSCNYSLEMINMLIKTYQFDKEKKKLIYLKFNIDNLINEAFLNLKNTFDEKNIKLYIKSETQNLVNGNKYLLLNLFHVLLSVAALKGEKNKNINVIIKKDGQNYVVIIAYQGNPLSKDECEKIFTEKSCFTTVGFGIKMYLCKKIVEIHGGTIQALTYGENVNMFTFKLPIAQKEKKTKTIDLYRLEHSSI